MGKKQQHASYVAPKGKEVGPINFEGAVMCLHLRIDGGERKELVFGAK